MTKTTRARYMLEFKQEAARLVEGDQSIAAAARACARFNRRWRTEAPILRA